MPMPTRPKTVPTRAAWPPWTSRTWVANSPPTPNIEMNDSSSGISDVAADVEVEDRAEDVVDEDGDQQQAAADERADDEDEVLDRDRRSSRGRRLHEAAAAARDGQDSGRASRRRGRSAGSPGGQSRGAEQQRQPVVERAAVVDVRRRAGRADPGASGGSGGAFGRA